LISLIGCLLGATNIVDFKPYETRNSTPYLTVAPDKQAIMDLGSLVAIQCRDKMTTLGKCLNYNVGTFVTHDSKTEYKVCFNPDSHFRTILKADEDIRFIKVSGNYFIMGEPTNACDNGSKNVRQASYIEVTDCNSN